ncbi:quinol monooxygenase YgiN [Rhizobium sp. BK181]|uniref:putative quinol monooxygenase n=1 Tax=Rhizobium sp. BK181 TaxID=2587072 RepID=UPI00161BE018|nr:putative quinol monooxygenase [Rhizobium sp. BK181]MBB3319394.1 quinol monooxygenase YgiN [Rhizobium sp. BK181]
MLYIKIMATLLAKPGKAEELEALLFAMAPECRMEPGNLRWDVWRDQAKADRYVLDELYIDNAAVAAHRETPHFKNYLASIHDLAERSAFVLDPVMVASKNG